MKTKKIPFYLLLFLLTAGAAVILGFLSFGGMYALWPILPLALAAFGLSVAYEWEIYFQNIKSALNKLFFKRDYLPRHLANDCLANMIVEARDKEKCPQFFKDYEAQLLLLAQFGHARLDKDSRKQKKRVKKTLKDMEKWFAVQLFAKQNHQKEEDDKPTYQGELQQWLEDHEREDAFELLDKRRRHYRIAKWFAVISGTFMALGTTYLLVGQFLAIPLLASIPFALFPPVIIPMALVAGIAWGLLTYNAITDMINHDTLRTWYFKLRNQFREGITFRNVAMALTALTLIGLAVALTVCTAGTWWTIAKQTPPLFHWTGKTLRTILSIIMGIINPIITGISALIWNVDNTLETFEMIREEIEAKDNFFKRAWQSASKSWLALKDQENRWQIANPFRILLLLTFVPLRILLFMGHLASISVTADRIPGIPEIASAILNFISEFFEDVHYFNFLTITADDHHEHHHEHHHEGHMMHAPGEHKADAAHVTRLLNERLKSGHGHSHNNDLPTRLLRLFFSPLFALTAGWSSLLSNDDRHEYRRQDFIDTLKKYMGIEPIQSIALDVHHSPLPSGAWTVEQSIFRVDQFKQKHLDKVLFGRETAREKTQELTDFQASLREGDAPIAETIALESEKRVYGRARFFRKASTQTQDFLAGLSERVGVSLPNDDSDRRFSLQGS